MDITNHLPLCFVAMPFGVKAQPAGDAIDFDRIFYEVIEPAIAAANLDPLRADSELLGSIAHKPMFERLTLSEFVIADLTTANANVFYELGIRHAVRPFTTILLCAESGQLPFDLAPTRTMFYSMNGGLLADAAIEREKLAEILTNAKKSHGQAPDSPLFQLLEAFGPPDIERLRTDAFHDRVAVEKSTKRDLRRASSADDPAAALAEIRTSLGEIEDVEAGVVVSLLLAYRSISGHQAMVDLVDDMPPVLRRTPIVREQHAFALNRLGRHADAVDQLEELLVDRGRSSETLGLLGRIHKDRWSEAKADGRRAEAAGHLTKAIDVYLTGFEADWRDAYPGINALTLMHLADPPDERRHEIAPVVRYSASADYWDHATLLEAAVFERNKVEAVAALESSLASSTEPWQPESTLNNLRMISEVRPTAEHEAWLDDIEAALAKKAGSERD